MQLEKAAPQLLTGSWNSHFPRSGPWNTIPGVPGFHPYRQHHNSHCYEPQVVRQLTQFVEDRDVGTEIYLSFEVT